MEFTVLEANNAPDRPVISVRVGPAKRQAQLEVNRPIVLPHPGPQHAPVEVGLFQELASQVLPEGSNPNEAFCSISVPRSDGSASQVKLRVCRGEASASSRSGSKRSPGHRRKRRPAALEGDRDRMLNVVTGLVEDVLREQPPDPLRFMLEQLYRCRSEAMSTCSSATGSPTLSSALPSPEACPRELVEESVSVRGEPALRPPDHPCPGRTGRSLQSRNVASRRAALEAARKPAPAPTQKQAEARYSIRLLLSGPACMAAAEESLREKVRQYAAKSMAALALVAARERLVAEAHGGGVVRPSSRGLNRTSRRVSWANSVPSTPQQDCGRDAVRRLSLPTPYVDLSADTSWGSWLSTGNSPCPTPTLPTATALA